MQTILRPQRVIARLQRSNLLQRNSRPQRTAQLQRITRLQRISQLQRITRPQRITPQTIKPQRTRLQTMSKLAVQKTDEKHIKVLTKNIIAGMQCCCADAVDLLDQEEADTDDVVSELCDVNSELDNLKVKLHEQLTKDDVTSNILKPLFMHLQAFTEIMKNIATSYGLKQACILHVIMTKLIDSYNKIVSKFYKDKHYKPYTPTIDHATKRTGPTNNRTF